MKPLPFTKDEIERANSVALEPILVRHGIRLKRTGRELCWKAEGRCSISISGSKWYSHYDKVGGGAISFMRRFFNLSFPEAMELLLDKSQMAVAPVAQTGEAKKTEPKIFTLPPASENNNRVLAYLTKTRLIVPEIVRHFIGAGMVYESATPYKNHTIHNLVLVGRDETGDARQAHMKGIASGSIFRCDAEGSDPRYGFAHAGTTNRIHVFEAAIDLMSYLTLYPDHWQQDSYVALGGVAEHALLTMLDAHPNITQVILSLDHDPGGQLGAERLQALLLPRGLTVTQEVPQEEKDWNEVLQHRAGQSFIPASEHPILAHMPTYVQPLFEEATRKRLADAPIERLLLGIGQYADYRDASTLQKCAVCAAVRAIQTLRQVGCGLDQTAFCVQICAASGWIAPQKTTEQYLAELKRDAHQIATQAAELPAKTMAQKMGTAQAYLTLAGKCIAVQIAQDHGLVLEPERQQEVSACQMQCL